MRSRILRIPYVIDNESVRLADVLNDLLGALEGRSLDVATAYFTVGGFERIRQGLQQLGDLRLLLGAEPTGGDDLGLPPEASRVRGLIRKDLEVLPYSEATLRQVEDLIAYLRRSSVSVKLHGHAFLHAKCWLFYSDRPGQQLLFERFKPVLAIVGSSNFTGPGLASNRELNLVHKVLLDEEDASDPEAARAVGWLADATASERISPRNRQLLKSEVGGRAIIELERWFERQWTAAREFKQDLIDVLDASKFGGREYSPFEVYMKALFEYFRDDLAATPSADTRSAVELSEFQEDAVRRARKILAKYDGVMIADSVGLGKTWIGKKLLEDSAYHMRQKALVVCPASLREMWEGELRAATIAAQVLSQEELGREEFDPEPVSDVDVVLVDESHNFRNPKALRYEALERILGARGGRGRDGARKKVILLTATPICNDLFDLFHQVNLITHGDRRWFAGCGIGDLHRYFVEARRDARKDLGTQSLYNLLDEVVIRRTRPFIRAAYPEATIQGRRIRFPERRLQTVHYDLEAVYAGIYQEVVNGVEALTLAPYNLESFKKDGVAVNQMEAGREQALVGIFKSRYLKRFESSVDAFRISVRRALRFTKTFEDYVLGGRLLKSADFQRALAYLAEDEEDDVSTTSSASRSIDDNEQARLLIEKSPSVDLGDYDVRRLHEALSRDVEILTDLDRRVRDISPEKDAKLARLKELLAGDLKGRKVLVFTYYKDTARYLYRQLGHPDSPAAVAFREAAGGVRVRRMDSGDGPKERQQIVQAFAPLANHREDWCGTEREIDVLLSTDVLSEGQNLQDCGHLLNYDLHWNPTRMVQRAGRIDRLGTSFSELHILNMFPDAGLERLLGLVGSLARKIADIDKAGFLDSSVLGEVVHPRNFNSLRRIRDEDGTIIDEEERFADLASSEYLLQQLRELLNAGGREGLDALPDGIHSGLVRKGASGVFFYFQAPGREGATEHFWRYCDLRDDRIIENRYEIGSRIACGRDEPRVVDPDGMARVFELQEKAIEDILRSVGNQQALEAAPLRLDPAQQTASTLLQAMLNHPGIERKKAIGALKFLAHPLPGVAVREIRAAMQTQGGAAGDPVAFLGTILDLKDRYGASTGPRETPSTRKPLRREDLKLVCFDVVSG